MTAEAIAIGIIKDWEKCRLTAYKPVPEDPWTVGWGATGLNITQGTTWSQDQADADLQNRVLVLGNKVRLAVKVPATDNQLAAFIDFSYNEGLEAFEKSTLLRLFNEGNVPGAGDQFLLWDVAHGTVLQGLENRREAEQRVYYT